MYLSCSLSCPVLSPVLSSTLLGLSCPLLPSPVLSSPLSCPVLSSPLFSSPLASFLFYPQQASKTSWLWVAGRLWRLMY